MNKILLSIFSAALLFSAVHTLKCYDCSLGLWTMCLTTTQTCASGQQCYSGVGKAAGFIQVTMKGCLDVSRCNQTSDVTFGTNNTIYKMTKTCCNSDLCNAAPGLSLHTLTLALTSMTSVLIAKALV